MNLLQHMELLEAEQINLGLYNTQVTLDSLRKRIEETEKQVLTEKEVENQLRQLVDKGEVIEWKLGFFRSRIAETVRCLRLLRQRLWWQEEISEAPLIVEDVRVMFRQRNRPRRNAVNVSEAIPKDIPQSIAQAFEGMMDFSTFSDFQARAIEAIYYCAQKGNPLDEAFIIAGDTGAGKTEAFLFPILLNLANEPQDQQKQPGVRAVFVYPRIRLARNQLSRMLRYTRNFQAAGGPELKIGIQNRDVPRNQHDLQQKWRKKKVMNGKTWHQVELLETCLNKTCGGHYWVAQDDPSIEKCCPSLICDTCGDKIQTLFLTQAALEKNAPHLLIITDVSLSQWLAREKYTHLWGLWSDPVNTIAPRFLVLDEVHLYEQIKGAHIARLIKRFQARVRLVYNYIDMKTRRPIVVGVSATLQDERRFLAKLLDIDPYHDSQRYQQLRVIKPEDNELEPTEGRERYIFVYPRRLSPTPKNPNYRINDQAAAIQIVMCAMHNLKTEPEWRGLAFFDSINDLRQFRHNYARDPNLNHQWIAGYDSSGREIPPANEDELWRVRTDRRPSQSQMRSKIINQCVSDCATRAKQASLYECLHFREGDCWVFAKEWGWNKPLKVASAVFAGSEPESSALDNKDLIPTSPSLEVGYDDDAIQLVYQHKAPPSAASFIQRRGRAGRDPDDSPVIITLLWPYRQDDAFYFFHPETLYDPTFADVPLNAGNFNVQRTHTLLAFFDLLACLRRQNIDGLRDDEQIVNFTEAGWTYFTPGDDVIQSIQRRNDSVRGQQIIIKNRQTKETIWFSGKHISNGHIIDQGTSIKIRGWLLMDKGLSYRILAPSWSRLKDVFDRYIKFTGIATQAFQQHPTYPFLLPAGGSMPGLLLSRFGNKDWHSSKDTDRNNWLKTFKYIDWMLQGDDEATTLTVHYPNPNYQPDNPEIPSELTANVTFGLTELLPGNVSYRLRESSAIHWTPIPPDGKSTFLYPEEDLYDENSGEVIGKQYVKAYLPKHSEITRQADSIFGVPRHLDQRYPGLPFIALSRLRVQAFGSPDEQYSRLWYYDPVKQCSITLEAGMRPDPGWLPISRRSSATANSVIIPYVPVERGVTQRQLLPPLSNLFASIDGFLDEGRAMLGYTRVYYEMQINLKSDHKKLEKYGLKSNDLTLYRGFFDEHHQPTLVGYEIETQGIRFQVNPDILIQTVKTLQDDMDLRLHLRRNYAIYQMGSYALKNNIFIKTILDATGVIVDYWLHKVVPSSNGAPRLLKISQDHAGILDYYAASRVVRSIDLDELDNLLTEQLFDALNRALEKAFRETAEFYEFAQSVILHSLSTLLKKLIGRLGGVGSDELVAYADLPILDQVDRSIEPRILIMDTVQGGSGGIAQAYERLDLTNQEGSLWWILQNELGNCPIANGEALIQAVLTRATVEQLENLHRDPNPDSIQRLLETLKLNRPDPESLQSLGRTLINETEVAGVPIIQALIQKELYAVFDEIKPQYIGIVSKEMAVRRAVQIADSANLPNIARLRQALKDSGVSDDIEHELGLQLKAIFESGCQDGCPVCLGANSDIEHHYLAPYLNSRRTLKKLAQVLLDDLQMGNSLAEIADQLEQQNPVKVNANPGQLSRRLDEKLGFGVVPIIGDEGQVESAVNVPIQTEEAQEAREDLFRRGEWEERWKRPEYLPYETPGGVRVRSRAEYIIATMLESAGYGFEYEARLPYRDEQGQTRFIHPDFYLFEHNLYVEYWGMDTTEYIESRRFKEQIYNRLRLQRGVMVLHLEANDLENNRFMEKIREALE